MLVSRVKDLRRILAMTKSQLNSRKGCLGLGGHRLQIMVGLLKPGGLITEDGVDEEISKFLRLFNY